MFGGGEGGGGRGLLEYICLGTSIPTPKFGVFQDAGVHVCADLCPEIIAIRTANPKRETIGFRMVIWGDEFCGKVKNASCLTIRVHS